MAISAKDSVHTDYFYYFCKVMNDCTPLKCEMIKRPGMWRLAMRADESLHVLLYSPAEPESLIYRAIPLDTITSSPLKALENAVYAHELLLSDFAGVTMLTSPDTMLLVPSCCTLQQAVELLAAAVTGDPLRRELPSSFAAPVVSPTKATNVSVISSLDTDTDAFLRRTFCGIEIIPSIAVLTDYFASHPQAGNTRRMYVNFRNSQIDLIVIDRGRLLHGTTVRCTTPVDAAYYVMASRRLLGLSSETDPVIMSGESPLREKCAAIIGRFVTGVLPAIFPAELLHAGNDVMKAPFDLVASMLVSRF